MKKIKTLLPILIALASQISIKAQQLVRLQVGDNLPEIYLKNSIPSNAKRNLRDYYEPNKIVLLDFWASWCHACIEELPKMDSLKKKYDGKLEVLVIAYEPEKKVQTFLKSHRDFSKLTWVTDDSLLSKLFPHYFIPHIVWIRNDTVIAITGREAIEEKNIEAALSGNRFKFHEKNDKQNDMISNPIKSDDSDIVCKNILSKFKYGLRTGAAITPFFPATDTSLRYIKQFEAINLDIRSLYIYAAYHLKVPRQNKERVIMKVTDSIKYCNPKIFKRMIGNLTNADYLEWQMQNDYCYEFYSNKELREDVFYDRMLKNLNNLFDIEGVILDSLMSCYALEPISKLEVASSSITPEIINDAHYSSIIRGFVNMKISTIVDFLSQFNNGVPIVDETHIPYQVNLKVNFDIDNFDIDKLNEEFQKNGLVLTKTKRILKTLLLKNKN